MSEDMKCSRVDAEGEAQGRGVPRLCQKRPHVSGMKKHKAGQHGKLTAIESLLQHT